MKKTGLFGFRNPNSEKNAYRMMVCLILFLFAIQAWGRQLAFPAAEGWGRYTLGGRGGKVYEVTNLNDSGPGSLRDAVSASGPRIVVFRVSGTIDLQSGLAISHPYITIAGQTAPGGGICVKRYNISIGTHDVIIRYLRVRLGDESGGESDALGSRWNYNIIIDHCSISWSIDETMSFYWCDSLSIQWCLISESLYNSNHPKGAHGYGAIWGGSNSTYHHNLFAHHSSRNPRFASGCGNTDYRNNVIYNWGFNSAYGGEYHEVSDSTRPPSEINMVANYYKPGPATQKGELQYRIVGPSTRNGLADYGKWYVAGNYVYGSQNATNDNWTYGVQGPSASEKDSIKSDQPFACVPIDRQTAQEAYASVMENGGATLPRRDAVDARIVSNVENGDATFEGATYRLQHAVPDPGKKCGIIDSQTDVDGWPKLDTGSVPADTDHDGMPDSWELDNSLDPNNPNDRNAIGQDGYTMLETYLNGIAAFPDFIPAPTEVHAGLVSNNTVVLTWQDNSSDETGFRIERKKAGEDYSVVATVAPGTTAYSDAGLPDLTLFTYRIVSFNDSLQTNSLTVEISTLSATSLPLQAGSPGPKDKELNVIPRAILKWEAGLNTKSQDVYFGTANPPPFVKNQTESRYIPDSLTPGVTYYWRIDEVNQNGITAGPVWSFTVKTILSPKKVAEWRLDEASGSVVSDSGPFHNDGFLKNMAADSWTAGVSAGALNFDGVDDYVIVPNNGSIDFGTGSFSIAFWLKAGTLTGSSMYMINKGTFARDDAAGTSGKWYGFEIKSDQLRFAIDDDAAKTTVSYNNITAALATRWNHIVGIRDSANASLKLYLNAVLLNTIASSTGDISEIEDLYLGNSSGKNAALSGTLDDIRIYNYALSDQEVAGIYQEYGTSVEHENGIPGNFRLAQNFPNPFNPATTIHYSIPKTCFVSLIVYNILGGETAVLVNEEKGRGNYTIELNADRLESGIYFYRMRAGNHAETKKCILLK